MIRRPLLLTLATALLAGCGTGLPVAGLSTATVERQHANDVPAPVVQLIPGYSGPAPSVTVKADVAVAPAVAAASQQSTAAVVAVDQSTEALELLAESGSPYQLQGWFQNLKDAIHRVLTRWKLKKEIKAALKKKDDQAFSLHEGEIDNQRKNRTAPITKVTDLADGSHEIVTTWNSTWQGDFAITTDRIVDTDGVTQALTVTQTGTTRKGIALQLQRARTLQGTDGSYQVVTDETQGFKDGRKEVSHWTKTVLADGTETITGSITTADGWTSQITGARGLDGKVQIEVSKIAPLPTNWPSPGASTDPGATSSADPGATSSADPAASGT